MLCLIVSILLLFDYGIYALTFAFEFEVSLESNDFYMFIDILHNFTILNNNTDINISDIWGLIREFEVSKVSRVGPLF